MRDDPAARGAFLGRTNFLANLYIPFTVNLQEKPDQHATLTQEQLLRYDPICFLRHKEIYRDFSYQDQWHKILPKPRIDPDR